MLEWAVSGPYIANMVCSTENTLSTNHHEDNDSFEKDFRKKRFSLVETFKKFENFFTESQPDLINIVSKEVMSEKATTSVRNAYSVGKKLCPDFMKERLCNSDEQRMSIYATVKKNRLALFQSKSIVTVPKIKRERDNYIKRADPVVLKLVCGLQIKAGESG